MDQGSAFGFEKIGNCAGSLQLGRNSLLFQVVETLVVDQRLSDLDDLDKAAHGLTDGLAEARSDSRPGLDIGVGGNPLYL